MPLSKRPRSTFPTSLYSEGTSSRFVPVTQWFPALGVVRMKMTFNGVPVVTATPPRTGEGDPC